MAKGRGPGLTTASPAPPAVVVHSMQLRFGTRGTAGSQRRMGAMAMVRAAMLHRELSAADVDGLHDGSRRFFKGAKTCDRDLNHP